MIWLFVVLLGIDLLSKYLFYDINWFNDSIFFIKPILNTGISRSMPVEYYIVIPITIIFSIFLIWFWKKRHIDNISFAMLLAGALWNLFDRIIYGGVRDWIRPWFGPVFNMADIYITIGVLLYIVNNFTFKKE